MFLKRDLVLGQEYLAFLLLNLFDLFMTGWIFKHHGLEANSLPAWILHTFGLRDFALFKFLMVVFIIVLCEMIALASVPKARVVIMAGCLVYLLVVMYESYLIINYVQADPPRPLHHFRDRIPDDESSIALPGASGRAAVCGPLDRQRVTLRDAG